MRNDPSSRLAAACGLARPLSPQAPRTLAGLALAVSVLAGCALEAATEADRTGDGIAESAASVATPFTCRRSGMRNVPVRNASELTRALADARCGDDIVVGNGSYSGSFTVSRSCTSTTPISIRPASRLGARIESRLQLKGSYTCAAGLDFNGVGSGISVGGTNNRVLGNRFAGWAGAAIQVTQGSGVEIAYNEMSAPSAWTAHPSTTRMGITISHSSVASTVHTGGNAHHNYFHDFPAKPVPNRYSSGQSDAMTVCESVVPAYADGSRSVGWRFEYNLIDRHRGGHGLLDIKCSGVVARFNTLLNAPNGRLDIRMGRGSDLSANWIENAGGMLLHGAEHTVFGNRLINTGGIQLEAGNVEWNYPKTNLPNSNTVATRRAYRLHLAGNRAPVTVGKRFTTTTYTHPAYENHVERNTPVGFTRGYEVRTDETVTSVAVPTAVKLTPSRVGLAVMPSTY